MGSKPVIIAALCLMAVFVSSPLVVAQTITVVVEGNGEGSSNTAATNSSSQTSVDQQNDTESNTTIDLQANTGGNEANGNSGNVEISTGDVETNIESTTTANVNQATVDCCAAPSTQTTISGNGANSANTVTTSNKKVIQFASNNTAKTTNTINVTANTGGNTANNNNGNVDISTGKIETLVKSTTKTNLSSFSFGGCCSTDEADSFKIKGNGENSENTISYHNNQIFSISQDNNSIIDNFVFLALNTGNNSANGNLGNITIHTGDIATLVSIQTETNLNEATIDLCCDDTDKPEEPTEPENPTTPPTKGDNGGNSVKGDTTDHNSAGSSNGSGSGGAGQIFGITKDLLPDTGGNYLLYMLIANILMFWLGCYLRLRSGRAPALAIAS